MTYNTIPRILIMRIASYLDEGLFGGSGECPQQELTPLSPIISLSLLRLLNTKVSSIRDKATRNPRTADRNQWYLRAKLQCMTSASYAINYCRCWINNQYGSSYRGIILKYGSTCIYIIDILSHHVIFLAEQVALSVAGSWSMLDPLVHRVTIMMRLIR